MVKSCSYIGGGTSYSLVQTLLLYVSPVSHRVQRHADRQTDDSIMPIGAVAYGRLKTLKLKFLKNVNIYVHSICMVPCTLQF